MIKSVLRFVKFPALTGCVMTNSASLSVPLNTLTSRNIYTTSLCNKEIRLRNEKVLVGKHKYGLIEGEDMIDTLNVQQQ